MLELYMMQAQKLLASVKGGGSAWEAVLQDARQSKVSNLYTNKTNKHIHMTYDSSCSQCQTTWCDLVATEYVPGHQQLNSAVEMSTYRSYSSYTQACKIPSCTVDLITDLASTHALQVAGLGDKAAATMSRRQVRSGNAKQQMKAPSTIATTAAAADGCAEDADDDCSDTAAAVAVADSPAAAAAVWWGRPLHCWTDQVKAVHVELCLAMHGTHTAER
jgi:hypothetical protein